MEPGKPWKRREVEGEETQNLAPGKKTGDKDPDVGKLGRTATQPIRGIDNKGGLGKELETKAIGHNVRSHWVPQGIPGHGPAVA